MDDHNAFYDDEPTSLAEFLRSEKDRQRHAAPQVGPDLTYADQAIADPGYMAQVRAAQNAPTQWDLPKPFTEVDKILKAQNAYNPPAGTSILDVLRDAPINKAIAAPFQAPERTG